MYERGIRNNEHSKKNSRERRHFLKKKSLNTLDQVKAMKEKCYYFVLFFVRNTQCFFKVEESVLFKQ